jgi:hypothetical protein
MEDAVTQRHESSLVAVALLPRGRAPVAAPNVSRGIYGLGASALPTRPTRDDGRPKPAGDAFNPETATQPDAKFGTFQYYIELVQIGRAQLRQAEAELNALAPPKNRDEIVQQLYLERELRRANESLGKFLALQDERGFVAPPPHPKPATPVVNDPRLVGPRVEGPPPGPAGNPAVGDAVYLLGAIISQSGIRPSQIIPPVGDMGIPGVPGKPTTSPGPKGPGSTYPTIPSLPLDPKSGQPAKPQIN